MTSSVARGKIAKGRQAKLAPASGGGEPSDGHTVSPSHGPTVEPCDRVTVEPSDRREDAE